MKYYLPQIFETLHESTRRKIKETLEWFSNHCRPMGYVSIDIRVTHIEMYDVLLFVADYDGLQISGEILVEDRETKEVMKFVFRITHQECFLIYHPVQK